jgi:DNA-binding response OmpR family regulator
MLVHSGMEVSVLNHTLARNKLDVADLEVYDLILIDMFDEDSESLELCRRLRAGYHSPILIMLYARDERSLLRAYEAGADDCLV